jgi:hypothetical protein
MERQNSTIKAISARQVNNAGGLMVDAARAKIVLIESTGAAW